jgi:hypothetical protein
VFSKNQFIDPPQNEAKLSISNNSKKNKTVTIPTAKFQRKTKLRPQKHPKVKWGFNVSNTCLYTRFYA